MTLREQLKKILDEEFTSPDGWRECSSRYYRSFQIKVEKKENSLRCRVFNKAGELIYKFPISSDLDDPYAEAIKMAVQFIKKDKK